MDNRDGEKDGVERDEDMDGGGDNEEEKGGGDGEDEGEIGGGDVEANGDVKGGDGGTEGETDSGDGTNKRSDISSNFLLLTPRSSISIRFSPNMQSFNLFTSDNCTGFTMKSSAPSSKHLSILATTFSEDIITTGTSLKVDDPLILFSNS